LIYGWKTVWIAVIVLDTVLRLVSAMRSEPMGNLLHLLCYILDIE
jgi:hypothetical protein